MVDPTDLSRLERRLAAILAADVAGYSRLMGDDERATVATLTEYRRVFAERVEAHRGRIVDTAGDSVLAVFDSVVEGVGCALDVQRELARRNRGMPEHRRMHFRIGVNLGDIIARDDGTVYGDGVNVAARLQALAQPGGLCVSGPAFETIDGKLDCAFESIGEQAVKNIAKPVRAYRVLCESALPDPRDAGTAPALPVTQRSATDRPVIAVLPFTYVGGQPEEDYFADGITEDVITELGRFQSIIVIARNTAFAYKGRAPRAQDVARDLGVHYVVEGTVRKAGQRVRVTVELVDAETGKHLWAERFDRDVADIFALQDELTQAIAAVLPRRLESVDIERIKRKPAADVSVYDLVLRAKLHHHRATAEDNAEGLRLLDRAIETDPDFAPAYAWRACTRGQAAARGFVEATDEVDKVVYRDVLKGLSLDENDVECVRILVEFRIEQRRLDEALALNDKALQLNPNNPLLHAQRGEVLTWRGEAEDGVAWLREAMRLDPYAADSWAHLLGRAIFGTRRYGEALAAFRRAPRQSFGLHAFMAACNAYLEDDRETARERDEILRLKPGFRAGEFCAGLFYAHEADAAHLRAGLLKAGLPD